MRLLLINQFVPPDEAPTARLLGDLKERLEQEGCSVILLGANAGYHGGAKTGLARLIRDARAHINLLWNGLRLGSFDWILCLTDPPGLPFTSALLARVKNARLAHWAMDVYPHVAVQLGALPEGLPSRLVAAAMRHGYRKSDVLVALDSDMRQILETCGGRNIQVQPPWPPTLATPQSPSSPSSPKTDTSQLKTHSSPSTPVYDGVAPSPARTWLYSGNLGRAHEFKDLLEAQRLLEASGSPWRLIFQGGGPCREEAQSLADQLGLKQCFWQPYAPNNELLPSLLAADVLIATQKESLLGLLWPSKLALMALTGRPILWLGPTQGQIASELTAASPLNGLFSPGNPLAIARWLSSLPSSTILDHPSKEAVCHHASQIREKGLDQWVNCLLASK